MEEVDTRSFKDVPDNHRAAKYIGSTVAKGFEDETFRPEDLLARIQTMKVVDKMLLREIDFEDVLDWTPSYTDLEKTYWGYCDVVDVSSTHEYKRKK